MLLLDNKPISATHSLLARCWRRDVTCVTPLVSDGNNNSEKQEKCQRNGWKDEREKLRKITQKMRNNWHSFSFRPPAIAPQLQVRVTSSCARLMRGTTRHCGDAPTPTTSWLQRRPSWRHSRFLLFPPHCCCHWSREIYFQKASRKLRTPIAAARF